MKKDKYKKKGIIIGNIIGIIIGMLIAYYINDKLFFPIFITIVGICIVTGIYLGKKKDIKIKQNGTYIIIGIYEIPNSKNWIVVTENKNGKKFNIEVTPEDMENNTTYCKGKKIFIENNQISYYA